MMNVEGWELKRLEEIGEIYSGATPLTINSSFWDGDIVWVTPNDLSRLNIPYLTTSSKKITKQGLKNCSAHLLPSGSIILSSRAPIGYVAISKVEFCTNQGCKSFKLKPEYNSEFVYYNLGFNIHKIKNIGEGTTFTEISKTALAQIKIPFLENKEEQRKIAEILSTIDRAISQTEAILKKQQRIKTGLMQDLLAKGIDEKGNIRTEETHEFKDSPLGRIPVEWEVNKFSQLTKQIIDGTHFTPNYIEHGIPFLRVTDIKEGEIDIDEIKYISKKEHILLTKRCKPEKGDILYSKNGTIGIAKIINWEWEFSMFVSLALLKLKQDIVEPKFIEIILSSQAIKKQIMLRTKQGTVTNLHLEEIREFNLPVPSRLEQKKIALLSEKIDVSIQNEQKKLKKLRILKKALMQDLLTGKVRVTQLITNPLKKD